MNDWESGGRGEECAGRRQTDEGWSSVQAIGEHGVVPEPTDGGTGLHGSQPCH